MNINQLVPASVPYKEFNKFHMEFSRTVEITGVTCIRDFIECTLWDSVEKGISNILPTLVSRSEQDEGRESYRFESLGVYIGYRGRGDWYEPR